MGQRIAVVCDDFVGAASTARDHHASGRLKPPQLAILLLLVLAALMVLSCDQKPAAPAHVVPNSVASLVPAATDLIVGMGANSHLVAVSNWDPKRAEIANLPRVGDYRSIDWEKLAELRPAIMVTQFHPGKAPSGLENRARELNIRLVNVKIDHLEDVFAALDQLAGAIGEREKGASASARLRAQLDAVKTRVSGRAAVRTLIVRSSNGLDVVGGGNFMDELLTLAGGQNVIPAGDNSYPTIDRELLLKLNPEVILQLLPGESPQVLQQARDTWTNYSQLQAVQNHRVYLLTDDDLLLPGISVARIAQQFASRLHPEKP